MYIIEKRLHSIQDSLAQLDIRLTDLQAESHELTLYEEADKRCRALECAIVELALAQARGRLESLEKEKVKKQSEQESDSDQLNQAQRHENINWNIKQTLAQLEQNIENIKKVVAQLQEERIEAVQRHAQLDIEINEAEEAEQRATEAAAAASLEFAQLKQKQTELLSEQNDYEQRLADAIEEERAKRNIVEAAELKLKNQMARQTRNKKYKDKNQRDLWAKNELEQISKQKKDINERIQQIKEERERNTEEMGIKRLKQEEKEKEAQNKQREMMIAQPHFEKTKLDRDSLIVQRKELWRTENQQQLALEQLNDEIQKSERMSQGRLGRGAAAGIAAVMKLKSLPGYQDAIYGHLADLIQVKKDNYIAIEVIGGQSLFNVVVRDEHIAAQLVRELQKSNAGRVTFIPLLSINPKRA
ncbi:MAG: putative Chromosome segregation protein sudA, partial [Streblomastix strix]